MFAKAKHLVTPQPISPKIERTKIVKVNKKTNKDRWKR